MIQFKLNGKLQSYDGDPRMPLLWYVRDIAGLSGTKFGCGRGLCGACTVHHNGKAVRSCATPHEHSRRTGDRHHRSDRRTRKAASRSDCLDREFCSAVWVLLIRTDHAGCRAAGRNS